MAYETERTDLLWRRYLLSQLGDNEANRVKRTAILEREFFLAELNP